MNLLAPVLMVLAIVIPAKLAGEGVRLRILAIGAAVVGFVGLLLFINGLKSAPPEAAATGDPGSLGTVGIIFIISALIAGITVTITGIVRMMSGKPKR